MGSKLPRGILSSPKTGTPYCCMPSALSLSTYTAQYIALNNLGRLSGYHVSIGAKSSWTDKKLLQLLMIVQHQEGEKR